MKKRGQLIYKALIVIVISAFIALFFPYVGKVYGSGEVYSKLAVAKDLALLIDTLSAYPGDMHIVYPVDLTGYTIKVNSNRVLIYDSAIGEIDPTASVYKFVKAGEKIIEVEIKDPKNLVLNKEDNEIKIQKLE
ncbi:MAG: hypothetical protein ACFFG0_24635 [Candidatus Thorarchaeota archaeon]